MAAVVAVIPHKVVVLMASVAMILVVVVAIKGVVHGCFFTAIRRIISLIVVGISMVALLLIRLLF